MLDEHGEAVEYDLLVLGIDVKWLWTGELSWRRLGVIVDNLPSESATKTSIRDSLTPEEYAAMPSDHGDRHGPWSRDNYLMAHLIDEVALLRFLTVLFNAEKKPDPFKPYPRPGVFAHSKKQLAPQAVAYLSDMRAKHLALTQIGE